MDLSEDVALGHVGPRGCQGLLNSKVQYKCEVLIFYVYIDLHC